MIIYCMSDIHGCLAEFEDALSLVLDDIEQGKAKLILLGDYVHGGPDNCGVEQIFPPFRHADTLRHTGFPDAFRPACPRRSG